MSAQDFLNAAERLPLGGLEDILGGGGAVVVAPHPDDESLGCGALIAAARCERRPLRVVVVSDGTGSQAGSKAYPAGRLRALREGEAREATAVLGLKPEHILFLGLPDRFLPDRGPEAERAAMLIAEKARETGAGTLFVTWRYDPHGDHRAAYAVARLAQGLVPGMRLFEFPIWGRSLPPDAQVGGPPRGFRFDGARYRARKRAAIACHRSQVANLITDDPNVFRLDPAFVARFERDHEIFLNMAP
jgi:LmbE family N-acetylglucosaminyl deacetylase